MDITKALIGIIFLLVGALIIVVCDEYECREREFTKEIKQLEHQLKRVRRRAKDELKYQLKQARRRKMSNCWYCNKRLTTSDSLKHFGICDKCYNIIVSNLLANITELNELFEQNEKRTRRSKNDKRTDK